MKSIFCAVLFLTIYFTVGKSTNRHRHSLQPTQPKPERDEKIVGGYNVTIESHPYVAYLIIVKGAESYQCGGSIISSRHVLTAAHCLTGANAVAVRTGTTNKNNGPLIFAANYKIHPQYDSAKLNYDVAVITLRTAIQVDGKRTQVVKLAEEDKPPAPGTLLTVIGWGAVAYEGKTSDTLIAVQVPVQTQARCSSAYRDITPQKFCAGYTGGGKDSCQGDSGGPAVVSRTGVQVGVVSYGQGCAWRGYPGVYTNVAAVRAWIKANSGV